MLYIIKSILLSIIFITSLTSHTFAETVHLDISDNLKANAEYYPGDKDKPMVFILHGFMLTHNFPTVKRLAESLNESGYNVLTPSLTLGVSLRQKSLACEAVHTHSVEKDINELEQWINWLEKKSKKNIILIGHSIGSILVANYLTHHPSEKIKKVIFIAMPTATHDNKTNEYQLNAEKLVADNDDSLHDFKLAYCKKYPTTAENFLSYLNLNKKNITQDLKKITAEKTLILGSEDNRVDQKWSKELSQYGMNVILVEGANHFFDYEHEFDLLDIIENILNKDK